jgi:hypothetical protein
MVATSAGSQSIEVRTEPNIIGEIKPKGRRTSEKYCAFHLRDKLTSDVQASVLIVVYVYANAKSEKKGLELLC